MRPSALLLALAAAASIAGCGAERARAPDLDRPAEPAGTVPVRYPKAGMRFLAPANWELRTRELPAVFTLRSGTALISGFAYPREEPLPRGGRSLRAAEQRLVEQIRERDPGFRLQSSDTTTIAGAPAVAVRGRQTISGREFMTRSLHLYEGRAEYVIEALAPPAAFELVDRRVLRPLLDTLVVSGRAGRARRSR